MRKQSFIVQHEIPTGSPVQESKKKKKEGKGGVREGKRE